jgi:UPF0755 protein
LEPTWQTTPHRAKNPFVPHAEIQTAGSKVKKTIAVLFSVIAFLLCIAVTLYLDLRSYAQRPDGKNREVQLLTIAPGMGLGSASRLLHEQGIISHPFKFSLLARIKGHDKSVMAGQYQLSGAMPPQAILDTLVAGKVFLHHLTVPEGFTLAQIADAVQKAGLCPNAEFLAKSKDPALLAALEVKAASLEGYLFPDTYFFPGDVSCEKILRTMGDHFSTRFSDEWKKRAANLGYSVHQIVTLASIIEKETGAPGERALIASVFHNRLKKGMRLESDPTVIYGIENFEGNITRRHLSQSTPYNTYKIKGLPPGPIASPGMAAIQAALYPANTPYLYFVSKKDGTHHFSTNIQDHIKAVQKYQLNKKG